MRRGFYDMGNHPTSRERALAHLYNNVVPNLSRIFKIPVVNFKFQPNYGFGWSEGRKAQLYSTENVLVRVVLRKRGLDVELISKLLPKALKAELGKQLTGVEVEVQDVRPSVSDTGIQGKALPPMIQLNFKTRYPDQWLLWDKQRYGITV